MKIMHICLSNGIYNQNWNYQENMLIKYHRRMGYEVTYIVGPYQYNERGAIEYVGSKNYFNEDNIHIIRLKMLKFQNRKTKLKKYSGLYRILENENPNIIFLHNIQFLDSFIVKNYKVKNQHIRLYVDNHADYFNSASNWISKKILHGIIWKNIALTIDPYVKKWYGVLPSRVDFLHDMYGIEKERIELLHLGGEDIEKNEEKKDIVKKQYNIHENDFLIVTGGKIDSYKWQTLLLMDAVNVINQDELKLIVFGSVDKRIETQLLEKCSERVRYIGWIDPVKTYDIFSMANLVIFPGYHSVFWEQVVSQGIPICVKYLEGITHINVNNNCIFLYEETEKEIEIVIRSFIEDKNAYRTIKKNAEECREQFLYSDIAKRAIEIDIKIDK